jgi:hypothetical protein
MEDLISQDNSQLENKPDYFYFHGSLKQENKYMDIIDSDEDNQNNNSGGLEEIFEEKEENKLKPKKNNTSTITSTTMNFD